MAVGQAGCQFIGNHCGGLSTVVIIGGNLDLSHRSLMLSLPRCLVGGSI